MRVWQVRFRNYQAAAVKTSTSVVKAYRAACLEYYTNRALTFRTRVYIEIHAKQDAEVVQRRDVKVIACRTSGLLAFAVALTTALKTDKFGAGARAELEQAVQWVRRQLARLEGATDE